MAYTVKRVRGMTVRVENRVGMLSDTLQGIRNEGLNLMAAAGWEEGGQAVLFGIPSDADAARASAMRNGVAVGEQDYVWVEGGDKPGALLEFAQRLAANGINVRTMHALAVGGKFGAVFSFAPADVDKVMKLYGSS